MIPKILTLTRNRVQLESLAPFIRYLYFRGTVDGMSIIATQAEFESGASEFIHRYYEEFSLQAPPSPEDDGEWIAAASARALREESPAWAIIPADDPVYAETAGLARQLGIRLAFSRGSLLEVEGRAIAEPSEFETVLGGYTQALPLELKALESEKWREGGGRLALASDPGQALLDILREGRVLQLVEPVNRALRLGGATFRYGDYDSEQLQPPASHDLKALLERHCPPASWRAEVLEPRGECPAFQITFNSRPLPWLDRFPLSGSPHRIVVADSQNIAGSVLNHCLAINRYTPWQATALVAEKHPFIDFECPVHFASGGLTAELKRDLEDAEVFLFFEDDDECSPSWPFDLRPYVDGKPVLHLYIGQRVHRNVSAGQRQGRTLLTPLPHLCRMFPTAQFYAGFPPSTLDQVELRPPRSDRDGILRVLHTPSLPHQTTHRYYYHKDTEAFLEAGQILRGRFPDCQFWQLGGLSHERVLQARQDCDITFNQLRGYHGLSGDEAMYLERPMVQAFDRHNINRHREYWGLDVDFPWVNARPGELVEVLQELLEDGPRRRDIGERSRRFMLEYFSPQRGIVPLIYHCERALLS